MDRLGSLSDMTIHGLLRQRAAERPDDVFLYFDEQALSFGELLLASERLAGGLKKLGIGRGDKVAIMMGNRPEFLLSWFAVSMLGAVEVPINTAHRGDLLRYMLDQADCTILIAEAQFAGRLTNATVDLKALRHIVLLDSGEQPESSRNIVTWEEVATSAVPESWDVVSGADPLAVMFTSGTTGPSKGAVLPQKYALIQGAIIADVCRYDANDCLYNALPLFHGNAQFLSTVPALLSGARMVLARRFSSSAFWGDVARHGCTAFNYIGGILPILWSAPPADTDPDNSLRLMMGAGAPAHMFEAFERRFGLRLIEGYGMSEIGVPLSNTLDLRRPGSCGRELPEYEVRLVDDAGAEVGSDVAGELLVRPRLFDSMMLEYYRMPEKTVEAWQGLWFHTGDYLKRDAEGYFYFLDRKKDALRRRGENISSFEVERSVNEYAAVQESAAVAVASELGEDEVMICVVPRDGQQVDPLELLRHCADRMARFMVPRYVRVLQALPKTPTERVQKFELRAAGVTPDTYDREADPAWAQIEREFAA